MRDHSPWRGAAVRGRIRQADAAAGPVSARGAATMPSAAWGRPSATSAASASSSVQGARLTSRIHLQQRFRRTQPEPRDLVPARGDPACPQHRSPREQQASPRHQEQQRRRQLVRRGAFTCRNGSNGSVVVASPQGVLGAPASPIRQELQSGGKGGDAIVVAPDVNGTAQGRGAEDAARRTRSVGPTGRRARCVWPGRARSTGTSSCGRGLERPHGLRSRTSPWLPRRTSTGPSTFTSRRATRAQRHCCPGTRGLPEPPMHPPEE